MTQSNSHLAGDSLCRSFLSWIFTVTPLHANLIEPLQNQSSMRNSDENWRDVLEKFRFSSSFVIHLQRWVMVLKCDLWERERRLSRKRKTTKCGPVGKRSEALS
ncbi:hypothetical protein AVEN_163069-1 [Araneus ventricosus]|uniref:Uncharacterized protein n=1 Tax=Araneus ventricosus TaxID=182803 RepID=A0A4Y2P0X4_ARAVE|nr:hypothetical protein AVEN_163069-1 [Araneus ventricosus]